MGSSGADDGISQEKLLSLYEALRPCVDATECNGPAFYMIAEEFVKSGKPLLMLTLGEVADMVARAADRYNEMCGPAVK
jgi:hypothetical protein